MKDGVMYNQKFNVSHYIDEKIKDPNFKLKFGNNEFTLAEINNILPSKEKKIDIFIEWENMCQYMSFGLVSVINEIINEERKIDIRQFMERTEYPNGFDYVKNVIYPDLDPKLIDGVIKKYYTEIMSRSPLTDFFYKMNLMKFMLNSVTFMFRYDVEGLEKLVNEISNDKFNNEILCKCCVYSTEEMEIEAIKKMPLKELYVVPDMGLYYKAMIENDKECTTILSYLKHNGVNPYVLGYYFSDFICNGLDGPNNIDLSFIHELQYDEKELEKKKQEIRNG